MGVAANFNSRYRSASGKRQSDGRISPRRNRKAYRGENFNWHRARQSDPQKPHAVAPAGAHGCGYAPGARAWLAEHVHANEKHRGVADREAWRRIADRDRATVDRRIVARETVSRLERRHQHIRFAFVLAGNIFSPASHERAQMPGH